MRPLGSLRVFSLVAGLLAVVAVLPVPHATSEASFGCLEFVTSLNDEYAGLTTDVLDRFALASAFEPSSLADRFALIAARGVAGGLFGLSEAVQRLVCHASRCSHCLLESAGLDASAAVREVGLVGRLDAAIRGLLRFLTLAEEVFEQDLGSTLQESPRLARQLSSLADHRQSVESIAEQSRALALDLERSLTEAFDTEARPGAAHGGPSSVEPSTSLDGLVRRVSAFHSVVSKLHGVVIAALDALPLLVLTSRQGGGSPTWANAETITRYFGVENVGHQHMVPWPDLVELAQEGGLRLAAAAPFSRASALCDADLQRLYRSSRLVDDLFAAKTYKDSSGASSWHGASVTALWGALQRAGHRRSGTFVAVLPRGMATGKRLQCADAHGVLYNPLACLEEEGWSGVVLSPLSFADGASGEAEGIPSSVLRIRREMLWASKHRDWSAVDESEQSLFTEQVAWEAALPVSQMDVLFLHPNAGNCALLPDLLGHETGGSRSLIYVPINPTLPPPLRLAPNFGAYWRRRVAWEQQRGHEGIGTDSLVWSAMSSPILAQCSLMQVVEMLKLLGDYELLFVEHLYAVFAHRELADALLADQSSGSKSGMHFASGRGGADAFEAWRAGWFCSPLSEGMLQLEQRAPLDFSWLGVGGISDPDVQRSAEHDIVCTFLKSHELVQDKVSLGPLCDQEVRSSVSWAASLSFFVENGSHPAVALRQRMLWALPMLEPLAGVEYHLEGLGEVHGDGDDGIGRSSASGYCYDGEVCECFAPFRGPRCDLQDLGSSVARARTFKAAISFIVNGEEVHVAELMHALRSLWKRFNRRFDYPVLIFHDGLSNEHRQRIVLAAPHRIWFHELAHEHFFPHHEALPPNLLAEDSESDNSHHSFSTGYRAQCRFRSGPVFAHPAVLRLDYLWNLDTDSMFPRDIDQDPFEDMHSNPAKVLGFRYKTITSPASTLHLWDSTLLYLAHLGIHPGDAKQQRGSFFSNFLYGEDDSVIWNGGVVMTDCEVLRVDFFAPGSDYYRYFEYLDALHGFWLHRWGDHAVRALGASIALWLQNGALRAGSNSVGGAAPSAARAEAYALLIPYAHQNSCFCEDSGYLCVAINHKDISSDVLGEWPAHKKIWECQTRAEADAAKRDIDGGGL